MDVVVLVTIFLLLVFSYDERTFSINETVLESSVVCMGKFAAEWKPKSLEDISPERQLFLLDVRYTSFGFMRNLFSVCPLSAWLFLTLLIHVPVSPTTEQVLSSERALAVHLRLCSRNFNFGYWIEIPPHQARREKLLEVKGHQA